MNKGDIKFKIDQLRKDKIIYGVEAVATNLAIFLFIFLLWLLSPDYFVSRILVTLSVVIGVGYTVFMGIGNFFRLRKIKELEKKL